MTLEQAKEASYILQKIERSSQILHNLKSYNINHIGFDLGHKEINLIVNDREFVNSVVKHSKHVLTEEIRELEDKLKLF